ncbi:two-component system sensor histidine kinase MprB [Halopolyspora algeriensis]|uniref:histidine kinase n=1 Tax=Halopolyspora algeriensis TaxID=1500506 RepID=A0A368VWB1_9ACTN|nr:HAMP domain-containing sensor histidine kinase [Halopolyspora algeriensis]RCW43693.1 two-component system sensor histidine kinase MprB [Halopolyspora algeriensis]TQM47525.1 two-component system sensor histidine kinase MprB [Halopolyspora algeriensis]
MIAPAPPPPDLISVPGGERETGRWQRVSLRNRVTLLAAICVAGAVALVSVGAFFTVRDSLYQQVDNNLMERATQAVSGPRVLGPDLQSVPAAFYAAANLRISLVRADGTEITGPGQEPPWGAAELAVARGREPWSLRTDQQTNSRVVAIPAADRTALVMSQSLQPTKATLAQLSAVLVVIGGSGILLAAAAGTAVGRTALRPVQRLTAATERVARTGELRPIPVSGDDELARLTTSFNRMLGALAESQEQQRRLVADAGHELRTPLTSLRTNLELLMASDRPDAPTLSEQDRDEMFADVRAQLTELSALVGDLVELAREDAPNAVHEPVELVDVVERALERARRRASGVEFDVRLQSWSMLGDATALERAVLNLLDNGTKWSPQGGTVRVRLRPYDSGFAVLEVADSGPGISPEDRPHVFERFYRSTDARTLPGSGLGLAIVKQVAERHGGSAWAGEAPEGGALLWVYLPGRPG